MTTKTAEERAEKYRIRVTFYNPDSPDAVVHGDDEAIVQNFLAGRADFIEHDLPKLLEMAREGRLIEAMGIPPIFIFTRSVEELTQKAKGEE